jgi:hypothetical protein
MSEDNKPGRRRLPNTMGSSSGGGGSGHAPLRRHTFGGDSLSSQSAHSALNRSHKKPPPRGSYLQTQGGLQKQQERRASRKNSVLQSLSAAFDDLEDEEDDFLAKFSKPEEASAVAAPQQQRDRRYKRRGSVTKFSLDGYSNTNIQGSVGSTGGDTSTASAGLSEEKKDDSASSSSSKKASATKPLVQQVDDNEDDNAPPQVVSDSEENPRTRRYSRRGSVTKFSLDGYSNTSMQAISIQDRRKAASAALDDSDSDSSSDSSDEQSNPTAAMHFGSNVKVDEEELLLSDDEDSSVDLSSSEDEDDRKPAVSASGVVLPSRLARKIKSKNLNVDDSGSHTVATAARNGISNKLNTTTSVVKDYASVDDSDELAARKAKALAEKKLKQKVKSESTIMDDSGHVRKLQGNLEADNSSGAARSRVLRRMQKESSSNRSNTSIGSGASSNGDNNSDSGEFDIPTKKEDTNTSSARTSVLRRLQKNPSSRSNTSSASGASSADTSESCSSDQDSGTPVPAAKKEEQRGRLKMPSLTNLRGRSVSKDRSKDRPSMFSSLRSRSMSRDRGGSNRSRSSSLRWRTKSAKAEEALAAYQGGSIRNMPKGILRYDDSDRSHLRPKKVTFGDVDIYEHPIILGDNPAVTSGAPVTIDWHCQDQLSCPVEIYENTRGTRRRRRKLLMKVSARAILLLAAGYTIDDIADASMNAQEIKNGRRESMGNQGWDRLNIAFETTTGTIRGVGNFVENTGRSVGALVETTGRGVGTFVESTGRGVTNIVGNTGRGAVNLVGNTGRGAVNLVENTGKGIKAIIQAPMLRKTGSAQVA